MVCVNNIKKIKCEDVGTQSFKNFFASPRLYVQFSFVLLFILPFSAKAQKISLEVTDEKIEDVLLNLAADHDFEIVFNASYFDNQTISINLQNQPIRKALAAILKKTKVDFSVIGKTILLTKRKRLYGYLIDKKTGEKLINAAVFHPLTGAGAYSNEHGFFSFEIPFEAKKAAASYIGFKTKEIDLSLQSSIFANIELEPEAYLSEVVILSSQTENKDEASFRLGKGEELLTNKINSYVASGGVPDIFQFLYKKPGVAAGPDGLGGLHVRGGNTDQNLILYDGVKVYNPSHAFGLFSIFNPNLLQHAKFQKSNFHPRNGGRISSVVDLRMKEGSLRNWNAGIGVSNLATEVTLDGPIQKDKTGLLLGFRRSHIDNFVKNYSRRSRADYYFDEDFEWDYNGEINYFLYDFNAKLHHRINKNHRVFLSAYGGQDAFGDEFNQYYQDFEELYDDSLKYNLQWGNQVYSFRWNHLWSNQLFSNFTISFSDFSARSTSDRKFYSLWDDGVDLWEDESRSLTVFRSGIRDLGADYDFDYFLGEKHRITFGAGFHQVSYEPGTALITDEFLDPNFGSDSEVYFDVFDEFIENAFKSNEAHVYLNEDFSISKKISLTAGARFAFFQSKDLFNLFENEFFLFQPKFAVEYRPTTNFTALFSAERIQQPVHLLTSSEIGFPIDVWAPASEKVKPQKADQLNLTFQYSKSDRLKITTSAYYKLLKNILRYQDGSTLPSLDVEEQISYAWQDDVVSGTGKSQGIEAEIEYQTDNFRADAAYTYSVSDRQFSSLNNGEYFPFRFDLRHAVAANFYQKINDKIWGYLNWQFSSGLPQTLYLDEIGIYNPIDPFTFRPTDQISDINGFRLKPYHRLDAGFLATFKKNKFTHELNLGVQNAYNRKNAWYTVRTYDEFGEEQVLEDKFTLPLLPVLRYKILFSE